MHGWSSHRQHKRNKLDGTVWNQRQVEQLTKLHRQVSGGHNTSMSLYGEDMSCLLSQISDRPAFQSRVSYNKVWSPTIEKQKTAPEFAHGFLVSFQVWLNMRFGLFFSFYWTIELIVILPQIGIYLTNAIKSILQVFACFVQLWLVQVLSVASPTSLSTHQLCQHTGSSRISHIHAPGWARWSMAQTARATLPPAR